MAKKIIRPPRVALLLACVALGAAAFYAWRWSRLPARVQAGLPAVPKFVGKPPVQAELIAQAVALTRSPRSALAGLAELGRLYHANGYSREAEACWLLLRQEQPREARWPYYLAELRRNAGDPAELGALLTRTVELAPGYAPAWLQLANLEFKTGQLDLAERHYQRRLALVPGDPHALLGLVRVAQQRGRPDEARRLAEQLVRAAPQFSTGHNLYAEMLAAAGEADAARTQRWIGREAGRFREADDPWIEELHAWCHDPGRLRMLAVIAGQTERGDQGRSLLARAIRLAPDDPAGYELLGGLERKFGDAAQARDALETGLRVAKTIRPPPSLYVALSETHLDLKQPAEALRVARLGLADAGDAAELHHAAGVALAELGRHEEAMAAFRVVLARNAHEAPAHFNLGLSLLALGRQDEARAALQRSLIQQPTQPKILSLLGRWELDAGRLDAAEEYLRPLYESHSEVPEVRRLLAQWRLASGARAERKNDWPAAEKHYRAGVALAPDHAELQASLGVLLLTQGRAEDARPPLEAYARLQPANPQSALFLGQAYLQLGHRDEARRILITGEQLARQAGQAETAAYCREMLQSL